MWYGFVGIYLAVAAVEPRWKRSEVPENEEPCWLIRRAGFSKIDDLVRSWTTCRPPW